MRNPMLELIFFFFSIENTQQSHLQMFISGHCFQWKWKISSKLRRKFLLLCEWAVGKGGKPSEDYIHSASIQPRHQDYDLGFFPTLVMYVTRVTNTYGLKSTSNHSFEKLLNAINLLSEFLPQGCWEETAVINIFLYFSL